MVTNMRKTKIQIVLQLTMIFILIMSFLPITTVFAEDYVDPSILKNLQTIITQDGNTIPQGGTITSTKPIEVDISFGVPVLGDDPTPSPYIKKGDTVKFDLSNAFTLVKDDTIPLKMGAIGVGEVTFAMDAGTKMVTATVNFNGDDSVFDGTSNTVTCQFSADFVYDGSGASGNIGDHTVTILEKTYTVNVPPLPIVYEVKKTGVVNLVEKSIEWTTDITAKQGDTNIDLTGYKFFDDLTNVGPYITGSFEVDSTAATPDATTANALSYVFPAGSTSPKTIKFKTEITDDLYHATSEQTVTNKAQLLDNTSTLIEEGQSTLKFTPKWIEKAGESSDAGSSGTYDPKNRTITWTITANHYGATLNDVIITDLLPTALTLESAKWQKWNGTNWVDDTTITPNANGEYAIGNIDSKILLTIVTKVPDDAYESGITTYTNSANIKWTGSPGAGLGTGNIGVGVGYNAISKSGVANTAEQKITWTVNVDAKKQEIPDLKVYDLLVYGNNINLETVTGIPVGIISTDLTPRYGQKYVNPSFTTIAGTSSINVIEIKQGGVHVADLLEITGLSQTELNTFTFESQILNPDIFAGNKKSTVSNTASLFSANTRLNAATANVNYRNNMLLKEMLKREAMGDPAAGVNNRTNNAAEGFDYDDKSAIFRINVNADGLNLTNLTNASGQTLGTATLTDTLPEGWEFVEIIAGLDYLIFEGTGPVNGTVTATDTTPDTVTGLSASFSGRTATFTFTTLDQPYVILVKAKPTNGTIEGYFDSNKTTTITNNSTLKTENWTTGVSSSQNIIVKSQILDKTVQRPTAGELVWTIDYKPYGLVNLGDKLEDQLPSGIDLRMDSSGKLLLPGNITVEEMTLNKDGTYTVGAPVTLTLGTNIMYDNATRVLSFIIPDSSKAYRFVYVTDITGEPETVTNKVSLLGDNKVQEGTSKPYTILASDGSASLLRNGWVSITKEDDLGNPLACVEFTLYAIDGVTIIKKGITGSNGIVTLKVIPDGKYIIRETAAPVGYTPTNVDYSLEVTTSGATVIASINGKSGADSNKITIQNFKDSDIGRLLIKKTVAGNAGDRTKLFDFTLTLVGTGSSETFAYLGTGIVDGSIKSGDTVSLTHGQSIEIIGLPKDLAYTVAEKDYSADGYQTVSTGSTGTIIAADTQTASFTNTRNIYSPLTGNLTISKTVVGKDFDQEQKFNFRVNFTGASGFYNYTANGVPAGVIASGDTISLADGDDITITGLPIGATYKVTEDELTAKGFTVTSIGSIGTISVTQDSIAAFTNTKKPNTPPGEDPNDPGENPPGGDELPVTGGAGQAYFYLIGSILILLGLILRRKIA